ncbi:glycosyltransferase [Altererythrobacter sp. JGD-16]|uniref:Glycosyltransferase n=2 Tax=Altererythrobacter lutimaris TaxID=2743979 RepID=A0A850H8Q8_9SPHN|nr:glycosyltransferase [Altererythrobacter lutimaris]
MDVTFAVASFNSGKYLEECVNSALSQVGIACEVIIVDDGSTDGSDALAQRLAEVDERVRFFRTPSNRGPGGARNIALENMRGDWYAVLDSDDLLVPERSERLIAAAKARGANMVADDLHLFGEGMETTAFLVGSNLPDTLVTLDRYFEDSAMYGPAPNPGFLKPMIARALIEETGIRYDEKLRVAEDDDLIIRLLMEGGRYYVAPEAGYLYRKHEQSISHRLSPKHAAAMGERAKTLELDVKDAGLESPAFRTRQNAMRQAVAFTLAIEALKAGKPLAAMGEVLREPASIRHFAMPIKARLKRFAGS